MSTAFFLDTCIFFSAIQKHQDFQVLQHLYNLNYPLYTSVPVLGEFTVEMMSRPDKGLGFQHFFQLFNDLDIEAFFPVKQVTYASSLLCKHNEDARLSSQYTDLIHLAYAMAYKIPVFLTTDRHLTHYRIPQKMIEKGFKQPRMMDLSGVKREYL